MPNKNSEIIGIIPLTSDIGINPQSGNGTAVSLQLIGVGKRHGGVSSVALIVSYFSVVPAAFIASNLVQIAFKVASSASSIIAIANKIAVVA
jgi:hypothetical protein